MQLLERRDYNMTTRLATCLVYFNEAMTTHTHPPTHPPPLIEGVIIKLEHCDFTDYKLPDFPESHNDHHNHIIITFSGIQH